MSKTKTKFEAAIMSNLDNFISKQCVDVESRNLMSKMLTRETNRGKAMTNCESQRG